MTENLFKYYSYTSRCKKELFIYILTGWRRVSGLPVPKPDPYPYGAGLSLSIRPASGSRHAQTQTALLIESTLSVRPSRDA
jgi:hypothetical protein